MVRLGVVRDAESLRLYIEEHVWPALVHFELPVVRLAREAALRDDMAELMALDEILDAAKSARELRDASRTIGRRRLHALLDVAPSPVLTRLAKFVEEDKTSGHHAVVFGAGLAPLPLDAVLTAWAFQGTQRHLPGRAEAAAHRAGGCAALPGRVPRGRAGKNPAFAFHLRDELGWFDPAPEIASMHHEIAHERLFIS